MKYYAILTFQTKNDSARTYYYEKTSFSYDVVLLIVGNIMFLNLNCYL